MTTDRRGRERVTVYRSQQPDGSIREVEYQSVADALHFACRDLRERRRAPLSIAEDGVVVHDAASIERACAERDPSGTPGGAAE